MNLSTSGLSFVQQTLTVHSGQAVTVNFNNTDSGIAHNATFQVPGAPQTDTCTGPCSYSFSFTAPAPGTYQFICTVHSYAGMKGTLVVQ